MSLIEGGRDDASQLLEDMIYSGQLPELIDAIEQQAARSQRFREVLLWSGNALGGKGGPEMNRIFCIIANGGARDGGGLR